MGKKVRRGKSEKVIQKEVQVKSEVSKKQSVSRSLVFPSILLFIISMSLYINTLNHEFVLDDIAVVTDNRLVKGGVDSIGTILTTDHWYGQSREEFRGDIYRPLSLVFYAALWKKAEGDPQVFHFFNILFYGLTVSILFILLAYFFKEYSLLFPFFSALIFALHPIHVEVVSNVKSLDEIFCLMFGLLAVLYFYRFMDKGKFASVLGGSIFFLLCLFSKESGLAFLLLVPISLYFFSDPRISRSRWAAVIGSIVTLSLVFLIARYMVVKDVNQSSAVTDNILANVLNGAKDFSSKYGTAFYVLLRYLGLLVFPHPLSHDYNFAEIEVTNFSDPWASFGLILYISMGVLAISVFVRKSIVSYSILFFLISLAPVSNLFIMTGATMGDRLLYVPSVGFSILLVFCVMRYMDKLKDAGSFGMELLNRSKALIYLFIPVFLLYAFKSYSRSEDWKSNRILLEADVVIADKSATANTQLARNYFRSVFKPQRTPAEQDTLMMAKKYFKKAVEIFPAYSSPLGALGDIYELEGNLDSALYYRNLELTLLKKTPARYLNFAKVLFKMKRYDQSIFYFKNVISMEPNNETALLNLGLAYSNIGDRVTGLSYISKLLQINPENAAANFSAGKIYELQGDLVTSAAYYRKAKELNYPGL